MNLTAIFPKVPEGNVAFIEELPGANTQGATLDEASTVTAWFSAPGGQPP